MITENLNFSAEVSKSAAHAVLRSPLATMDNLAHVFTVQVLDGGTAADLSGAACRAYFVRADGVTVMLDGTVDGSTASVTLGANCYAVPGRFTMAVKLEQGDTIRTILRVEGSVTASRTDAMTGAGSGVHSFDEIEESLAQLEETVGTGLPRRDRAYNLLDNSNFRDPVAQAGLNGRHSSGIYFCDRWIGSSDITPEQQSGGVQLVTSLSYANVRQNVKLETGKTYTFAVYATDVTATHRIRAMDTGMAETISTSAGSQELLVTTFTASDDIMAMVYYPGNTSSGGSSTLQWAALYEGEYTADTLPAYMPKGFAAELLECQRYFRSYEEVQLTPYYLTSSARYYEIYLPQPMQAVPTVTISSGSKEYCGGWNASDATLAVMTSGVNDKKIKMSASGTADTSKHIFALFNIEVSADL